MSEIGNFVHKILDMFMRDCVKTGSFVAPDELERRATLNRLADQYLSDYIGNEALSDKQFMHIYRNMVKTVDFVAESLCKEFSQSKFTPKGFEFKIGLGKDADIPAISYDVEGKTVYLRGSIDRVDTYEQNGITYVRVIDYKTYAKKFSADLVAYGIDTQLLHYLFAYCDKTGSKPAGALYYTVTLPNVNINGTEPEEVIKKQLEKQLSRNGIVLDNEEVVYAMSPDLSFVPVSYNKTEGRLKSKSLRSEDEFVRLSESLKNQVESLATNVFCGNMDIAPNDFDGKADSCKYCPLGEFCRSKKTKEDDEAEAYTTAE